MCSLLNYSWNEFYIKKSFVTQKRSVKQPCAQRSFYLRSSPFHIITIEKIRFFLPLPGPTFSTKGESPVIGGDSACRRTAPFSLLLVVLPSVRSNRFRGMPQQRGRRRYIPQPQRGVKKNILRISSENKKRCQWPQAHRMEIPGHFPIKLHNSGNFGKCQSRSCDDLRRPHRDAPAALQLPENSAPRIRIMLQCLSVLPIVHGLVRNSTFMPVLLSNFLSLYISPGALPDSINDRFMA
jgi:hypothetical protein